MSESALRRMLTSRLRPYGRLIPIESHGTKGVPDYAYALRCRNRTVEGWCEAKFLDQWPKRPSTPVRVPKLKLEQVRWQESHHEVGGRVSTLLQVGRSTYALLSAPVVRELFERKLTSADLVARARVYSADGFPTVELLEALTA